jgi:hypothetical protein
MKAIFCALLVLGTYLLPAQQDLLAELSDEAPTAFATSTFKGTRVVNGHSVETRPGGTLEFSVMHRFGTLNSGGYYLWGMDYSTIRLGLEYGITDRLGVSVGRSSLDKSFDAYLKYKMLRQGKDVFPVTITGLASAVYNSSLPKNDDEISTVDAFAYTAQVLVARKFGQRFSLQLSPSLVHRNMVDQDTEVNTLIALGLASRISITRSFSVNLEYYARLNENANNPNYNPLGIALEFETGGHVFQLIFTNSLGMMERRMIAETQDDFFSGDVHFGFNITRTFQLHRKK